MLPYDYLNNLTKRGQMHFAKASKVLVRRYCAEYSLSLESEDASFFLEPLLFASLSTSSARDKVDLAPLFFSHLNEEGINTIPFRTDAQGLAYFPRIGCFSFDCTTRSLEITASGDEFTIREAGKREPIEYSLERLSLIPGTDIELCRHPHPLMMPFFLEWDEDKKDFKGERAKVDIVGSEPAYVEKISQAFDYLGRYCPEQHEQYDFTTRRIVLFYNPKVRNFAVRNLHGTAFICAKPNDSVVYFLEEIAHQCAHNVFNAITANLSGFFRINPETPLKLYSGQEWDYRSIYSAFHGLYTVATRLDCFDRCMDSLVGEEKLELVGRFADLHRRFRNGLEKLDFDEVFTPEGYDLYQRLDNYCDSVFKKREILLDRFDLSNQSGEFDAQKFFASNPPMRSDLSLL